MYLDPDSRDGRGADYRDSMTAMTYHTVPRFEGFCTQCCSAARGKFPKNALERHRDQEMK